MLILKESPVNLPSKKVPVKLPEKAILYVISRGILGKTLPGEILRRILRSRSPSPRLLREFAMKLPKEFPKELQEILSLQL